MFSYPSGIWSTQIVSALFFAWLSDSVLGGRRWPPLIFVAVRPLLASQVDALLMSQIWHCIICALLAATPVYAASRAGRWVSLISPAVQTCERILMRQVLYYFSGVVNCTPGLLYACKSDNTLGDCGY